MTNADMNRPTTTPPMQMPTSSQSSPPGSSVSGTHATSTAGTVDSRRLRLLAAGCPGVYEELPPLPSSADSSSSSTPGCASGGSSAAEAAEGVL